MVRRVKEVPALFAGWPANFEWYELTEPGPDSESGPGNGVDSGEVLAVAGLDWVNIPGGVGLHLEILPGKWGKPAYRACGEALTWLKAEARARRVTAIVGSTTNAADARRWFKFTELFGFTAQTTMLFSFCRLDGEGEAATSSGAPKSKEEEYFY